MLASLKIQKRSCQLTRMRGFSPLGTILKTLVPVVREFVEADHHVWLVRGYFICCTLSKSSWGIIAGNAFGTLTAVAGSLMARLLTMVPQ